MELKSDKKKIDSYLDEFNGEEDINTIAPKKRITERTGLIERVDKVYVTQDGRQLLREQY